MAEPDRSADGRWIIGDGRRWRATDPSIPEKLRAELVAELMAARRAVGQAGRRGVNEAMRAARARVQAAKVALGERGQPWWEAPDPPSQDQRIAAALRTLLEHRDGRSICPSDVARVVGGMKWRAVMPDIRRVAFDLAATGRVRITQRGASVATNPAPRGPIRITLNDEIESGAEAAGT